MSKAIGILNLNMPVNLEGHDPHSGPVLVSLHVTPGKQGLSEQDSLSHPSLVPSPTKWSSVEWKSLMKVRMN